VIESDKDFSGNFLSVGDTVLFSRTYNTELVRGVITRFTNKRMVIKELVVHKNYEGRDVTYERQHTRSPTQVSKELLG
jgi:hypothetical protein